MKKITLILILPVICLVAKGQQTPTANGLSLKAAQVVKLVELDNLQLYQLQFIDTVYLRQMDSALNYTDEKTEISKKIYQANRYFDRYLFEILSETQKMSYIRNASMYDVLSKTMFKIDLLRKTEKYSEAELEVFTTDIFNYLMLEQTALERDRYFIVRQEDNIQQLKLRQPSALLEANALLEARHRGVQYQNGYKW